MLVFRMPFEARFLSTDLFGEESLVSFSSFDLSETLSFKGNIKEIPLDEVGQLPFILSENNDEAGESREEYFDKLSQTIQVINAHQLPKLVIARRKIININEVDIPQTLKNLAESYPSAFIYAFQHKGGVWMGAFSEVLGKYDKKSHLFETMSLAGTLPVEESWTKKEIEEQKPVSSYIHNILSRYAQEVRTSETYDFVSGNIKHLRTDFSIKIEESSLDDVINDLHPKPAVCGIPKDFCKEKIREIEGFDREFYAGYSKVEIDEKIYYFVNLRCGKFYKNSAVLFVGGGITRMSSPEKEWRETELKSQALGRNITTL